MKKLKDRFIAQINKTVEAHETVLKEMEVLRQRNKELLELRDSLGEETDDAIKPNATWPKTVSPSPFDD